MKKEEKIEIKVDLPSVFEFYDIEGDIFEVAEKIKNIPNLLKERYSHIEGNSILDTIHRYRLNTYYYSDETPEINITGYRWETDEEFEKRIETNKKKSAAAKKATQTKRETQEKKELALLKSLKEKYGDK